MCRSFRSAASLTAAIVSVGSRRRMLTAANTAVELAVNAVKLWRAIYRLRTPDPPPNRPEAPPAAGARTAGEKRWQRVVASLRISPQRVERWQRHRRAVSDRATISRIPGLKAAYEEARSALRHLEGQRCVWCRGRRIRAASLRSLAAGARWSRALTRLKQHPWCIAARATAEHLR